MSKKGDPVLEGLDKILGPNASAKPAPSTSARSDGKVDTADLDTLIQGLQTADPVKLDLADAVPSKMATGAKVVTGRGGGGVGQPCAKCQQKLVDANTSVGGKYYHPECFICCICDKPLTSTFFQHSTGAHCESCYGEVFRCSKCKSPISGEYMSRDNKFYHPKCLPKRNCLNCMSELKGTAMNALGGYWHPECFVCCDCKKPLTNFYADETNQIQKKAQCVECYERRHPVAKCKICKQVIEGEYLTVGTRSWHKSCFKCEKCSASLADGKFYDVSGSCLCPKCGDAV